MAMSVCPSCHERFRYDSREELEVLAGDTAAVPDGGPRTYRSHQRVVHTCPIWSPGPARLAAGLQTSAPLR